MRSALNQFRMLVCLAVLIVLPAMAQDRGTIRGTVSDESGAAVPGAPISVSNADTGLTQNLTSADDGRYEALYLPVGTYTIATTKPGFKKASVTGVHVDVNAVLTIDLKLMIGAVDQSVEVSAASVMLETQGTNLGKTIPTQAINDLPLFISGGLRSTMAFIVLTPGVLGGLASTNPRISGGLTSGQSELLDGAESQSERRNDAALQAISVEALQEFKVQGGAYSAEFGRTSNGVINFVSKSGTNDLHGSAFLFNRNEFFNARGYTFTPTVRPVTRQWNPGFSVGGPVIIPKAFNGRNKAFFFFAYEDATTRNGRSSSLVTVPNDAFRNGDLRGLVDSSGKQIPLYDPFNASGGLIQDATQRPRLACNGVLNVICPNRISPLSQALMANMVEPDNPNLITNNTRSYTTSSSKSHVYSVKGDYVLSDKHRVSFLYSHYFSPAQPNIAAVQGLVSTAWNSTVGISYYRVNDDYIFKPNLLNHLTLGFNTRHLLEAPGNTSFSGVPQGYEQAVQIPGTTRGTTPGKSTEYDTSYVQFGNRVNTDSRSRTTSLNEQLAWVKGSHTYKFGFVYLRSVYRRIDCNNCQGEIAFSSTATGSPAVNGQNGSDWASFLLGLGGNGSVFAYGDDIAQQWPYYAWYAQDDWKVNNKLTINVGLRYDLDIPKTERNSQTSQLSLTTPNPAAGGLPGAMVFAGTGAGRTGMERFGETRKNGFGPRLGLAWQLTPKTVIRAGSGIYYQPTREDGNADKGVQGFGGLFTSTPDSLAPGISFLNSQGFNTFSQAVQANKPPVVSPTIQLFGTPNFYLPSAGRAPYFVDWQFTVERNFWNNSVLRATYHATIGNKLLTRLTTLNQLDPRYLSIYGSLLSAPLSTVINNPLLAANGFRLPYAGYPLNLPLSQALRPFPQYGNIDMSSGGDNSGHMTYHALEASFEHRFGIGLFMLASYTFEKTLTNAADSENPFQSNGPAQNSYNLAAEKSVASTDTPQNLRISTVYDLPVGRGRKFLSSMPKGLDWAFGGWKVSAIQTYVSGLPLTIVAGQNMYGAAGVIPVSDGTATLAGTVTTRGSFAPGVGTSIPLINPAWNSSPAIAYSVPYLNPAAFVYPVNGQYGNTPSRVPWIRGAKITNEDIALLKSFHFTEKRYAEIRASASNAPNRVVLASADPNMTHPTFGKITQPQGNSPRSVQLGLKIYF
jgi:Carboxypeptidase regulatory-like domain